MPAAAPSEELRCGRSDGRSWRCKNRRIDGRSLCSLHERQNLVRSQMARVSMGSRKTRFRVSITKVRVILVKFHFLFFFSFRGSIF